jgi:Lrp/AsnC family transcriptional regulator
MTALDRIDRRILQALMRDATLPVAQLAAQVGLSPSPCWKRVQKLDAAGVITGRVALVDPARVGLGLTVLVQIVAADHSPAWRAGLDALVAAHPSIVEAHRLAGEVDYALKVVVPDMAAYDAIYRDLTHRLPCRRVVSAFSMECLKATTVLPVDTARA